MRIWSEWKRMSIDCSSPNRNLEPICAGKKESSNALVSRRQCGFGTGIVIDQVFEEAREGDYDLIVTGTSPGAGSFPSLHHGRSHPQHFESRKLSGARGARGKINGCWKFLEFSQAVVWRGLIST